MIHGCNDCWDTRNAVVVDTLDYDFSPGGLLNKVKDGKGNETNYLYDAVGRLSGIWAPNYGTISYRYDAGGRLKEKWLPNGVNTRYVYNADNTLTQAVNRATTASIISQHDYLYDAYANRRQHIEKIGATSLTFGYTFDALDRKRVTRPRSLTALMGVEIRYAAATVNQFRCSSRSVVFPAYHATTLQDPVH